MPHELQWPSQKHSELNAFYGNPDADGNGRPDASWERDNLVGVVPPFRMVLSWQVDKPVRSFPFHKRAAPALRKVLDDVLKLYPARSDLERTGIHLWGGAYNFRLMRGSNSLSMHSWACAIDFNPEVNRFGRVYREHLGMMPMPIVDLFRAQGFTWGGLWRKPDPMHFQAAHL